MFKEIFISVYGRNRPVFCKKVVLRNFVKFTGKHLCQSLRPATLLKRDSDHRCFPVNFAKFLRTPFFTEHLRCFGVYLFCLTVILSNPLINRLFNIFYVVDVVILNHSRDISSNSLSINQ